MMPHNPPYYAGLLERGGFRKAKDLLAFEGGSMEGYVEPPERAQRAAEVILRRAGLAIRPLDLREIRREVNRIRTVYNACWEGNWGFVPITESEAAHMARAFRPVVVPEAVPMIEKDGRLVAFALAVPDLNQVLRGNRSGRLLPVALKLLWALRRESINRARILLLGVLPEYRGKGIDAILWHWVWSRAGKHNMTWGEASWILEDNAAMANAAERMGFRRYKTYRLYDRTV
jgi:GNAT superfamily N-acetyltransferase